MKFLTAILLILAANTVNAQSPQSLSLNVYGGYTLPDRVRLDNYYTDIQGAFEYGGGLEYFVQRNKSIEFKYMRMESNFPLYTPGGTQINKGNDAGALNFWTIGGNNYFARTTNQRAIPFVGFGIGLGTASGPDGTSGAKFAWDAKIGVKLVTKSSLYVKLDAYIQSMISTFGVDFWYYPGWGGPYAVSDYAHIFQFGLGGAIGFDFRKK